MTKEEKEKIERLDNGGELILEPEPASNDEPEQQATDSPVSKSLRKGRPKQKEVTDSLASKNPRKDQSKQ